MLEHDALVHTTPDAQLATRPARRARRAGTAPLPDLRRLEDYCRASSQRCSALEHSITRLEHDIDVRIQLWDQQLASFASVDERAKTLTAQLTAQLAALRSAAGPQVTAAKTAVAESKTRVKDSDALLETSVRNVESARLTLDKLQRQFENKELALERAESWLSWLTGLAIIIVALLSIVATYLTNFRYTL